MAFTVALCKYNLLVMMTLADHSSRANVLIILIVVGFTVHFVKKNRLARQGKIVIQGQEGFYYTL